MITAFAQRIAAGLVALALAVAPARADMLDTGLGGGSAVSYLGPGDVVSGAIVWWGLRAYSSAVASAGTQKAVSLENTSTLETCDFKVSALGSLATASGCSSTSNGVSLATFCASTNDRCDVTTLYDQSGAGLNLAGSTSTHVVTIRFTGGLPTVYCNGSCSFNNGAAWTNPGSTPQSFSFVAQRTASFTSEMVVMSNWTGNNASPQALYWTAANQILMAGTTNLGPVTASDSTTHAFQFAWTQSTGSVISVDNTETSGTSVNGPTNCIWLFANSSGSCAASSSGAPMTGYLFEAGEWNLTLSSAQRTAMCHNQRLYYGTPGSC